MKFGSRKLVQVRSTTGSVLRRGTKWLFCAASVFCLSLPCLQAQGSTLHQGPFNAHSVGSNETSELQSRIAAATAARTSNDPYAIAQANYLVIATALREMGTLRSSQGAYRRAIPLFEQSLTYEKSTFTTLGLAYAEARDGKNAEALKLIKGTELGSSPDEATLKLVGSVAMEAGDAKSAIEPFSKLATANPSIENLYALGNCLLQTRTADGRARAIAVFDQMKKRFGDSGSLHVLIGRAYRDAGDLPAAVAEFRSGAVIDPHTPHVHYFLGLATLALNEWKPSPEAESEIKQEAAYYPQDYLANYMTGFLASGERRYDEAQTYLNAAAKIDPTAPEPSLYLGLNAYAQGDMKEAELQLRKAVLLTGADEARSNFQIRRAYVDLGRILTNSGRKEEAETFLMKARELQNRTMEQSQQSVASMAANAGSAPGAAVMPLGRQQEQAAMPEISPGPQTPGQAAEAREQEKILRAVLGLAFNDLATSEAIRKQYSDAFTHYQQAVDWDETLPGVQRNLGLSAYRSGNFGEAIPPLTRVLKDSPDNTAVRALLGISYFNLDQYADAAKTFSPLGERGMRDGETGYAWAASLAHLGDNKRAAEVLSAFAAEPWTPQTTLLVGQLWTVIGDYDRATATFRRLLNDDPQMPKAHLYSGLAYIHWQHWPDAEREFRAELSISPDDLDAAYHLGYVCMQQARMDEAVELFRKVLASNPNYSNADYQLGKILLDRGQVSEAEGYLEAAARTSPRTDYVHYQLQVAYRKDNRISDADRELAIYKELKSKSRESAGQGMVANP